MDVDRIASARTTRRLNISYWRSISWMVRPNTVLPANFKIPRLLTTRNASGNQGNRHHPYPRGQNRNDNGGRRNNDQGNRNSGRSYNRNNNGYNNGSGSSNSGNNGANGNNGPSNGSNYYNQANNGYRQSRHENAMIAITAGTVSNVSLAQSGRLSPAARAT
jgi:hypothetical protein